MPKPTLVTVMAALSLAAALSNCSGGRKPQNQLVGGAGDSGGSGVAGSGGSGTGGATGGATGGSSGATGGMTGTGGRDAGTGGTGTGGAGTGGAGTGGAGTGGAGTGGAGTGGAGTGGTGTGGTGTGGAGTGGMGTGGAGAGGATGGRDGGVDAAMPPLPKGPLRVDAVNPRYFTDGSGKIVFLVGSHTWQTLKDRSLTDPPPAFDYNGFLDFLAAHNHNFFRLWTWEQPHSWNNNTDNMKRFFQPFPWKRTGPGNANDGKPKFDLNQLDQAYFDRMRARVVAAGNKGIYVAITLFNGWDVNNAWNPTDGGLPYQSGNNVNGIAADGVPSQMLGNAAVTSVQEAYVRKVVDTVNDLDNVLYEISNESNNSSATWQFHFVDFIKQYQSTKPKRHPVGMTSAGYPAKDADLFASNADWVAPEDRNTPGDGRKVVLIDTDHAYYWTFLKNDGPGAHVSFAWQTFTRGASPVFMDPYLEPWSGRNNPSGSTPDSYWEPMRNSLGNTRRYADRMDLQHAVPSPALSSTGNCLAKPGSQYLVYQPGNGGFSLNVMAGTYTQEWFNPTTGMVAQTGSVTVGTESHAFSPPFSGAAVLFLSR
jgi:hypothetical protein